MSQQPKRITTIKYMWHFVKLFLVGLKRNVLRIHGVGGAHRIEVASIRPRFERSYSFRRRYNGRHFLNIWEPTWTY
jgi:hypothetical protein